MRFLYFVILLNSLYRKVKDPRALVALRAACDGGEAGNAGRAGREGCGGRAGAGGPGGPGNIFFICHYLIYLL